MRDDLKINNLYINNCIKWDVQPMVEERFTIRLCHTIICNIIIIRVLLGINIKYCGTLGGFSCHHLC